MVARGVMVARWVTVAREMFVAVGCCGNAMMSKKLGVRPQAEACSTSVLDYRGCDANGWVLGTELTVGTPSEHSAPPGSSSAYPGPSHLDPVDPCTTAMLLGAQQALFVMFTRAGN